MLCTFGYPFHPVIIERFYEDRIMKDYIIAATHKCTGRSAKLRNMWGAGTQNFVSTQILQVPKFSVSELRQHSKKSVSSYMWSDLRALSFPGMQQMLAYFYVSLQLSAHEECHWFHHVFMWQIRTSNSSPSTVQVCLRQHHKPQWLSLLKVREVKCPLTYLTAQSLSL